MKYFNALMATLLLCATSQTLAQPTITRMVHQPQLGDMYDVYPAYSTVDPGPGGANVTWNFQSGITGTDTFPNAYTDQFDPGFVHANMMSWGFPLGIMGFLGSARRYIHSGPNEVLDCGWDIPVGLPPAVYPLSDPALDLAWPMTYGDSLVDTWAISSASGDIAVVADGYGTLILGPDTIPNVLRIRREVLSGNPPFPEISWRWFTATDRYPVFWIMDWDSSARLAMQVEPVNIHPVAVEHQSEFQLAAGPNPIGAQRILYLESPEATIVDIELFDIEGNRMTDIWARQLAAGRNAVRIPDALSPGIYLLRLCIEGKSKHTQKIVLTE